jgi:hypothetical protein
MPHARQRYQIQSGVDPHLVQVELASVTELSRLRTGTQSWHYRTVPEAPADCSRAAPMHGDSRATR